ncbi:MAG: 4Fe-4S binding protein [Candidatus Cloacimonetes bacterium]|nr:4Fe-4S binding protein [Candidatus Cloacimonadota bacterium]MBL7149293.1 4Fe-4S binding protein [Candidatus Cloacimonadota bacterium]
MNKIKVGLASCGIAAGAKQIQEYIQNEIKDKKLNIALEKTGCIGMCYNEPLVEVFSDSGQWLYGNVTEEKAEKIIEHHAQNDTPIKEWLVKAKDVETDDDSYFAKQLKIASRNCGIIDPTKIDDYISTGGYESLKKAFKTPPQDIINEIMKSGIRGRGGGGFPTGVKWESAVIAAKKKGEKPIIVCNADEGDPGAFMDRNLMESDPHTVLEGLIIGAYAIGAEEGYIYIRREYPLALKRIESAVKQAQEKGFLGQNILGSDFKLEIKIHRGAGAFVCGESTALMASMSGRAGEPKAKYVHNVEVGYREKPTVLNNVETFANIPVILEKSAKWFAEIGSGDVSENPWGGSSGTKVFSLVGNLERTGLIEVPMGITLREIVYDIGGGIPKGRKFKAIQTGGPSGGCLPESHLDLEVDFDSLTKAGSMMGSGGMIVMDDKTCMVDVAKYFITFLKGESCGKCTPCREGLIVLDEILTRITKGKGKEGDIELMDNICETMKIASLCELGKSASNPVLSTIKYFIDEYVAHIKDRKCPAGVCKELIKYKVNDNCTGCTICAKNCPVDAISGKPKEMHFIDQEKCTKCDICNEVCNFDAITVE